MVFREINLKYWENHMQHTTHSVNKMQVFMLKQMVHIITIGLQRTNKRYCPCALLVTYCAKKT
jgi:hypothetical protein